MEFKGTKEKWEFSENGGVYVTTNSGMICDLITSSQKDKADALLISKAPEILEMLQKIVLMTETCNGTFEDFRERYNTEIKQLIKEATEL